MIDFLNRLLVKSIQGLGKMEEKIKVEVKCGDNLDILSSFLSDGCGKTNMLRVLEYFVKNVDSKRRVLADVVSMSEELKAHTRVLGRAIEKLRNYGLISKDSVIVQRKKVKKSDEEVKKALRVLKKVGEVEGFTLKKEEVEKPYFLLSKQFYDFICGKKMILELVVRSGVEREG